MSATLYDTSGNAHREAIDELNTAMDSAQSLGLMSLDLTELEEFTVAALKFRERANALVAAAISEAESAMMAQRNGFKSLNAHLASKLNTSTGNIAPMRTIGFVAQPVSAVRRRVQGRHHHRRPPTRAQTARQSENSPQPGP